MTWFLMATTLPKRNVTRNRWRSFLIIIGIAISVGLETGIAVTIDSLYGDFIESHRGDNFTDITIHPKEKTTIEEMKSLSELVRTIPGTKKVGLVATITYMEELAEAAEIPNNILIYGLETNTHPDFPNIELNSGNRTLEFGEAIISQSISDFIDITPGERYPLPKNPEYNFLGSTITISGIMKDKSHFGNHLGYLFVLLEINYLLDMFSDTSLLNFHLVVQVNDFVKINTIAEEIEDTQGLGLDYYVYREKSISENELLAIRSYQAALNLIIIASFAVEFLFITNILTINVRERSKEFGVLRAIGTSNRQIITYLGLEILIYSGIGSFLGITIGIGFSVMLIGFLNLNFPTLSIQALLLLPTSIITTYITGILVALISGLYPIFTAINLPIVQNIHWKMRKKKASTKNWIYLVLLGALLTVIGIGTTYFIGPSRFLAFEIISWHFFVVFSVFIGTLLLEAGVLHFIPNIGMKLMVWHRSVPRTIATRNIKREFQKSIVTIMVAALALTFILVVGITSRAVIGTIPDYYNERYGVIDIVAETKASTPDPAQFTNQLVSNNTNIERAGYLLQQRTKIENVNGYVFGIDPNSYNYFFKGTMLAPADPNIPKLMNKTEKGAIVSHLLRDRIGLRIGENLSIQVTSNSSTEVTITGIAASNPFLQQGLYIFFSDALFQDYWQNDTAKWFVMSISQDNEPLKTITDRLSFKYQDVFHDVISIDFYTKVIEKSLIVQTALFQMLFLHTFLLSGLAQFICILISTLKMEREIGIMRALGLSKREVISTFFGESTLLGLSGVAVGIINGLIGGELMAWYISQSIPIETDVSWTLIAFWVTVAFLITVVSTIIPSYRSSIKNVANAINTYVPRQMRRTPLIWPGWENVIDEYLEERSRGLHPNLTSPKSKKDH
ncbi:MAG: FtsX-like permease family protein [Candidatus Heimdallarchaeota archaeon]|nr:MAG: FtsX-like permease family protein [Candidatus Heimdallarchaeota archaeon]